MPTLKETKFWPKPWDVKKVKHLVAQIKYLQYLILCLLERMCFNFFFLIVWQNYLFYGNFAFFHTWRKKTFKNLISVPIQKI